MDDHVNLSKLAALCVLYVEDDLETREELQKILATWVDKLYVAVNGHDGFKLFKKHHPDIVITDIQMPEYNGLSMSTDIKQIRPNQPIVILSAYNDVEFLFQALELGIQHYITKPISLDRLQEKLLAIAAQLNMESEIQHHRRLLEQYKLLVDEKAIVAKINLAGNITYVNQHFCNLSGYSEDEILNQSVHFACFPNYQEKSFTKIWDTLIDQHKWTGIVKNQTKEGGRIVIDVTIVAILDKKNNIEEFVALMVDITEYYEKYERLSLNLKQDLDQQRHYLHEYERAMELGTSLCVIDPGGTIISANNNFCTSISCQPEELVGESFNNLVQGCSNLTKQLQTSVNQQGYLSKIIKIRYRDNPVKTFSTVVVAIRDIDGNIHSYLGLSQDITEAVRLNDDILDTQKELLYVMGEVVENRSEETGKHVKRVAELSKLLAVKYGLSDEHSEMIKVASPMHDIGKVGIADAILHKHGQLDKDEFEIMKTHAELGFKLLNKMDRPLIKMAATIAHEHHEHFDGKGYPRGLSSDGISIEGRIVALADVFDALGSKRCYKEPWDNKDIIEFIKQQRGCQFEPVLVDLLLENLDQVLAIRNLYQD